MMKLKVLKDIPSFKMKVWIFYPSYKKDDIINFDEEVALTLIKKGLAEDTGEI